MTGAFCPQEAGSGFGVWGFGCRVQGLGFRRRYLGSRTEPEGTAYLGMFPLILTVLSRDYNRGYYGLYIYIYTYIYIYIYIYTYIHIYIYI